MSIYLVPLLLWLLDVPGVALWEVDGTSTLELTLLVGILPWTDTSPTFDATVAGSCNGIPI